MSLFARIALAMAALVLVMATAIGAIGVSSLKNFAVPRVLQRLALQASISGMSITSAVDEARADVLVGTELSAVGGIMRASAAGGVDPSDGVSLQTWRRRLEGIFEARVAAHPAYRQFRLIGVADGGREIVRVDRTGAGRDDVRIVPPDELQRKGDRDYVGLTLKQSEGEVYVSPVELNQERGIIEVPHLPVLRIGTPVFAADGTAFGILIINIDMGAFFRALHDKGDRNRRIYVVNDRGDLLLAPDPARAFAFQLGGSAQLQDDLPVFQDAAARERDWTGLVEDAAGQEYGLAFTSILLGGVTRLGIVEALPAAELYAVLAPAERSLLIGAILAALGALLIAVVLARTLTQPLDQLTAAVEATRRGEKPKAPPKTGPGEIVALARSFDAMAREVQEKAASLAQALALQSETIATLRETSRREKLLSAAVESSDDAIVIHDLEATITAWNQGAQRLYGYSAEEAIGRKTDIIVPPERREEIASLLHRVKAGERIDHFETVRIAKSGRHITVSISVAPVWDDGGTLIGASKIARDITAQKEQEAAIARYTEELKRSNAELEQFAYIAAHDLQEPLRMVASYTELLAQRYGGQLDERADKYIHYAVDGAARMKRLIADLLLYSRIGTQGKDFARVDTEAVARGVVEQMGPVIRESDAQVDVEHLPEVMGDDVQLAQLFQNLIGNAIKFRGEATPRITIRADREKDLWVFSVADNGIGIDSGYAERIFQMFQRLHERGRYDGSGIGLTIAKRIVERHGGRIWFESEPGRGTTFFFTLPEIQEP
ncbi:MEKHLA domain-containing protein [Aurantimonas sp. MSK8Z-1]|uniref:sensor histidine kinase n=1 Tax=Mangrovibrevibacter kandeliae TaxID=2968473 RepID=UPI0021184AF3|nr:ATP-binding protein [Aurantimonas sp. MSK8Z-1]MCW4115841.1 MEKHLA domain-containing protein [Aurantimonas sp. MSK8Z-1]